MKSEHAARIRWVDYAKGIGIFLVVFGHALRGLNASKIIENHPFQTVDDWIYSFHMPLFFLLSGLFADRLSDKNPLKFLINRFETVAYPYLIWATLQTIIQASLSQYTNTPTNLAPLKYILIIPISQYWFLYILFLTSIIYYALRIIKLNPAIILAIFITLLFSEKSLSLGPWPPLSIVRHYCMYYALGSCINYWGLTNRIDRLPLKALILMIGIGFGLLTLRIWTINNLIWIADPIVALLGIVGSIGLSVLLMRLNYFEIVRILGIYSLEIYLAHTIFCSGVRIILQKICKIENPGIHIILGMVIGLFIPIALAVASQRFHFAFIYRFPQYYKNINKISLK